MKKLMIAAVASMAAVGAFAIESANVVGYNNTAARADLNWYAPVFRSIGYNTTDIQDIDLSDGGAGMVGWGDSMQIVGPLGNASENYAYWDPSMDPAGVATTCYWGDDACNAVAISFDEGDGIAIDNANALTFDIVNAGQVATNDVSFAARADLNWSGNPFPVVIDIQAISLDDGGTGMVGWGDSMQIVGPLGNASENYAYWDPSMDPAGAATTCYWGNDVCEPVTRAFEPGEGFAVDNANGLDFNIKIACPY